MRNAIFFTLFLGSTIFSLASQSFAPKYSELMPLYTCPECGEENVHPIIHFDKCPAHEKKDEDK